MVKRAEYQSFKLILVERCLSVITFLTRKTKGIAFYIR